MKWMILFGFDFSIAKPAMCCYNTTTKEMQFYTWPKELDKKSEHMLIEADVNVRNRNLPKITEYKHECEFTLENVKRATELAQMICYDVKRIIGDEDINNVYVSSEGLAFGAKGNMTLDLSGYKYVMLSELYKLGIRHIYTYNPIVLKSTAKMGRKVDKDAFKSKEMMIESIQLTDPSKHKFINTLVNNPAELKKAKNYCTTVDDLVDSYWALRAMCERDLNLNILT